IPSGFSREGSRVECQKTSSLHARCFEAKALSMTPGEEPEITSDPCESLANGFCTALPRCRPLQLLQPLLRALLHQLLERLGNSLVAGQQLQRFLRGLNRLLVL